MKKHVLFLMILLGASHGMYAAASHDVDCDEVIVTLKNEMERGPIWYSIENGVFSKGDSYKVRYKYSESIEDVSSLRRLNQNEKVTLVLKPSYAGRRYEGLHIYTEGYDYEHQDYIEQNFDFQYSYFPTGKNCQVTLIIHSLFPEIKITKTSQSFVKSARKR